MIKLKWMVPVTAVFTLMVASSAMAQGSARHSAQASQHASAAIGHGVVASAQLASGAIAVPLGMVAAVGEVSGDASEALWKEATGEIGGPLPVSDETFTAGPPPDQALWGQGGKQ